MSKNMEVKQNAGIKKTTGYSGIKLKINSNPDYKTTEQLHALLLSVASSTNFNLYINSLTTGWKKDKARKILKDEWQIKDPISVHQTLDYIINEGDRTTYNILIPHFLSSDCKTGRKSRLKERYMAVELLIRFSDNLSDCIDFIPENSPFKIDEADLKKSILAWDMCQLVTTSRIAFDAGYLTDKEAWKYIYSAYELCCNEYDNWEEIFKSIFIGSGMKIGMKKWFNISLSLFVDLLNNPENSFKMTNLK